MNSSNQTSQGIEPLESNLLRIAYQGKYLLLIGAIIGGRIGDSMDKADHVHTQNALETAKSGQRVTWTNPDTGADYTITPTRTYQRENGQYCRDFKTWGWIDGYEEELHGTACRMSDGTWRKVS